jgi:hypothetical protein
MAGPEEDEILCGLYGLYATPGDCGPWMGDFGGPRDKGLPSPPAAISSLSGGGQYGLMAGGEVATMLAGRDMRRGAGYGVSTTRFSGDAA